MGEATAEAATRSTRGPIMAARAADSSTADCSAVATPTAIPLAAAAGAPPPDGRPALERAADAPSPAPDWDRGTGKETLRATGAPEGARQHTEGTHRAPGRLHDQQ